MALCVVGAPFNEAEQKLIADLRLTNHVEHYGYPTNAHLAKLYRQSIALVYPSLYEGFGIPPLEAMACGTAVIASNVASIPEVVGEAGLLFDPFDTQALVKALTQVIDDSEYRGLLRSKGFERARNFNWKTTAQLTLGVYERAAKKKRTDGRDS